MGGGSSATTGPTPDAAARAATEAGTIELEDGALVLTGDIGDQLCDEFRRGGPALGGVDCIDARRVTLRMTGLDDLFDIRAPRT